MTRAWLAAAALVVAGCTSHSTTVRTTEPATSATSTSVTTATVTTTAVTTTAVTTTAVTTTPSTAAATTAATSTPYRVPVADAARATYAHEHHDYPASDVFVGCGATLVSPVDGTILEARRVDAWTAGVDNPATRGGKSISILGDDGVRYYLAHLDSIAAGVEPGAHIGIGGVVGAMGRTGKAGACHVHVGISPPCPGKEWAVRRGVIWPWPYLDAWRVGRGLSPAAEVGRWLHDHPDACAAAMADPHAADA